VNVPAENARAEADSENGFGIGMDQPGQVSDHALQLHIERLGGRFYVPVDVDIDRAVVPARNGDRGIAAFSYIEDFGLACV